MSTSPADRPPRRFVGSYGPDIFALICEYEDSSVPSGRSRVILSGREAVMMALRLRERYGAYTLWDSPEGDKTTGDN